MYHVPETVFEELEEGVIVPEEDRYFSHRETFDFECYFDKEKAQELENTEKLTWQSAHVPLSVSVCSNVPGYETPKCFVSEGDSDLLLEEFIQYLVSISSMSSSLFREKYADVFEALKTARGPESRESHEDRLAQMLVEIQESQQTHSEVESEDPRRDIDLMARDNEDDE